MTLISRRWKTTCHLAGLVAAVVSCNGCGTAASELKDPANRPTRRVWLSPSLELSSLSEIRAQIARPFPEPFPVARVASGARTVQDTVSSCSDYFVKTGQGFQAVSDQDFAVLQATGARCHALRLLDGSGFQVAMPAPPLDLRRIGLDALPPILGPQVSPADRDAREAATKRELSWRAFEPAARFTASAGDRARITGVDWSVVLELWAIGDFDGRGTDQLLVFTRASGTEGNWQESKLRILGRPSPAAPFRVMQELIL